MANVGIFEPFWSTEILNETRTALAKKDPKVADSFNETSDLMNQQFPNALISNYEYLLDQFEDVDVKDRHVMAAAKKLEVGAIVTFNLKHFPENTFDLHGIEVKHPDDFLLDQADLNLRLFEIAIGALLASYKRTPMDAVQFSGTLIKAKCPQFGALISKHAVQIDRHADGFRAIGV